eukprot:3306632-Prymnesium_polylepis.2
MSVRAVHAERRSCKERKEGFPQRVIQQLGTRDFRTQLWGALLALLLAVVSTYSGRQSPSPAALPGHAVAPARDSPSRAAACRLASARARAALADMAMEVRRTIADAHEGAILCVAYNAQRREIFTGSQDTLIKVWLAESGELLRTLQEHAGWVTGLAFAPELRVLFSCSIDGRILVWSKNELLQKEKVGSGKGESADSAGPLQKGGPLYCLAWDARRHNLVAGANGHIWVYTAVAENVDLTSRDRPLIKYHSVLRDAHSSRGMEEPVRAIISTEGGKLFSVGYDRSLCIWDTDHLAQTGLRGDGKAAKKKKGGDGGVGYGDALLKKTGGKDNCHDGAISAVTFDPDNNWIIT